MDDKKRGFQMAYEGRDNMPPVIKEDSSERLNTEHTIAPIKLEKKITNFITEGNEVVGQP